MKTSKLVIALLSILLSTSLSSVSADAKTEANLQDLAKETQKKKQAVTKTVEQMATHSTLAGSVKPVIQNLLLTKEDAKFIFKSLWQITHWEDLAVIFFIGWLTVPMLQIPYSKLPISDRPFHRTYLYLVADHLQQIAKISLAVYLVDIFKMICIGMGFDFSKLGGISHVFAQTAYTVWGARRVSKLKKHLLRHYVSHYPETFGRVQIVNRLLDAIIYGLTCFFVLHFLQVEMGIALSGILAFGSAGTLAIGLASKDLTAQILNGLMLSASDRIYEGDSVRLSSGQSGTIHKLGWMETVLRGSDEVMVSIPNTDLVKQRVSNLSRVRFCQVKQTLRFKYEDAEKIPLLLENIKEEIRKACPALITDGSRPFRAHWTNYEADHLEVVVDAHFRIKPVGSEYHQNRQAVLQAIVRAVRKTGLSFHCVPT